MATIRDINEFFASTTLPPRMAAAKAKAALAKFQAAGPGTVLYFGFPALDEIIAMLKGYYYLIAARPGAGKTAFLMQLVGTVLAQLPQGYGVMVFSAEMDASSLMLREACGRERLPYWDAVRGKLTPEQFARLGQRLDSMGEHAIYIDESPAPTLRHMAEQCQDLVDSGVKVGLIMFDYLQLAGEMGGSEKQRIDDISRGLAALAKQFDCPVLALGQANRSKDQDENVSMSQLMYGGEQQPAGIIIMDKPYQREPDPTKFHPDQVDLHVVKHRNGPMGQATLRYVPSEMRFVSVRSERVMLNK